VTTLPWGDDGVAIWQAGHTYFLAGHNLFKHAPLLGENLARAVADGSVPELFRPESRLGAG
jgi:sarcosine oxidase